MNDAQCNVLPSIFKACMLAQQAFNTDSSLMWEWCEAKCFDMAVSPTQTMPAHNALNCSWGEHCSGVAVLTEIFPYCMYCTL